MIYKKNGNSRHGLKLYLIPNATMNVKYDIDISSYKKFVKMLFWKVPTQLRKKKIFAEENVKQFLENAPDEIYLATKEIKIIV